MKTFIIKRFSHSDTNKELLNEIAEKYKQDFLVIDYYCDKSYSVTGSQNDDEFYCNIKFIYYCRNHSHDKRLVIVDSMIDDVRTTLKLFDGHNLKEVDVRLLTSGDFMNEKMFGKHLGEPKNPFKKRLKRIIRDEKEFKIMSFNVVKLQLSFRIR